jgi:hypothetical protein
MSLPRRKPLQARTRLRRGKPLDSSSVLVSRTPLQRTATLNPVSDKRRAENRERRKMADAVFGDRPLCGIRWGDGCAGWADDLDEILSRGRGGSITDAANTTPACRWCHTQKTEHPAEAEHRGFLLPSGRPSNAAPRWWAPEITDGAA